MNISKTIAYAIILLMLKSLLVMFLWNLVIPIVFISIPTLAYGHAFILTLLIKVLITDYNKENKTDMHQLTILDIKTLLFQLVNNQIIQNNQVLEELSRIVPKPVQNAINVPETKNSIDSNAIIDYNTNDSENSNESN